MVIKKNKKVLHSLLLCRLLLFVLAILPMACCGYAKKKMTAAVAHNATRIFIADNNANIYKVDDKISLKVEVLRKIPKQFYNCSSPVELALELPIYPPNNYCPFSRGSLEAYVKIGYLATPTDTVWTKKSLSNGFFGYFPADGTPYVYLLEIKNSKPELCGLLFDEQADIFFEDVEIIFKKAGKYFFQTTDESYVEFFGNIGLETGETRCGQKGTTCALFNLSLPMLKKEFVVED